MIYDDLTFKFICVIKCYQIKAQQINMSIYKAQLQNEKLKRAFIVMIKIGDGRSKV